MSVPDYIRKQTIGEEPGQQRSRSRQERARRERRSAVLEQEAAKTESDGADSPPAPPPDPGKQPSSTAELPTAVQLSNRMRIPVASAKRYLDMGCVEVDAAGAIKVNGAMIG